MRDRLRLSVDWLLAGHQSYTALTIEELTRHLGISRATFYVYFEDKNDLLGAMVEAFVDEFLDAAARWWSLGSGLGRQDLRAAMSAIADVYLRHQFVMAAFVEVATYDAALRESFRELVARSVSSTADHIATGQQQRFIDPSLDPQPTAEWLTWMAERGMYQLVAGASRADVERLVDALTAITWNALYAPVG